MIRLLNPILARYYFWRASQVHYKMVRVYAELTAIQRANKMVQRYVRFEREVYLEAEYAELTSRYENLMAMHTAHSPDKAANIPFQKGEK